MLLHFVIACASTPSLHTSAPSEPKPLASSDQIRQRGNRPDDASSCSSVKEGSCPKKGDPPERKAGVCGQPFFNMENPCDRGRLGVLSCDRGLLQSKSCSRHLRIQPEMPASSWEAKLLQSCWPGSHPASKKESKAMAGS